MQHLEVSNAVRPIYALLGFKGLMLQSVYTETTGTHNNYIVYPCVWHGTGCNAMLLNQTSPQSLYITYF